MMDGSHLLAVLAGQTTAALAASARPDAPVVEPREPRDRRVHGHRWWRTVWRVRRARGVEPSRS
ncbi:hypothetical protein Cch01nite_00530 [Cellulomonas chitinilytica]|uniref:Uncharacterized protein n=2 Tax=Cellulomonas chitinilytica TaxID=398759 RepID=A0A919U0N6_9CELL|nr:hypothetical protein Cch01nite_00530 [Cellulomonas chitinilytica]